MFISAVIALIVIVGITIAFSQPVSSKADETFIPDTRTSRLGGSTGRTKPSSPTLACILLISPPHFDRLLP